MAKSKPRSKGEPIAKAEPSPGPEPTLQPPSTVSAPAATSSSSETKPHRPVKEFRLRNVKVVIWANRTEKGIRHGVRIKRLYKDDQSGQWHDSDVFGINELAKVEMALRMAQLWIWQHGLDEA